MVYGYPEPVKIDVGDGSTDHMHQHHSLARQRPHHAHTQSGSSGAGHSQHSHPQSHSQAQNMYGMFQQGAYHDNTTPSPHSSFRDMSYEQPQHQHQPQHQQQQYFQSYPNHGYQQPHMTPTSHDAPLHSPYELTNNPFDQPQQHGMQSMGYADSHSSHSDTQMWSNHMSYLPNSNSAHTTPTWENGPMDMGSNYYGQNIGSSSQQAYPFPDINFHQSAQMDATQYPQDQMYQSVDVERNEMPFGDDKRAVKRQRKDVNVEEFDNDIQALQAHLKDVMDMMRPYAATSAQPYPNTPPAYLQTRISRLTSSIHSSLLKIAPSAQTHLLPSFSLPPPGSTASTHHSRNGEPLTKAEQEMEIIRRRRDVLIAKAAQAKASSMMSTGSGDNGIVTMPRPPIPKSENGLNLTRCHGCGIDGTLEWRRGPDGAKTLCDACGLHYAKLSRKKMSASPGPNQMTPLIS